MLNQIAAIHGTGVAVATNSYESIATVTVGAGGSSSISFSSIPNTFKHLQIRLMLKGSLTDVGIDCFTSFNSDTTSTNYYSHYLLGTGSATAAGANANRYFGAMPGTNSTNVFSGVIMDLLDYANTNKYKTGRLLYGYDMNGSGYVAMQSVLWKNTAAINAVSIASATGGNFQQYSQAALYGIKG